MHIPVGFLDAKTIAATTALSAVGLGVALRQVNTAARSRRIPLIGLTAAFVFAAQMLNFPVAGGTSGHLMGAVLAAVMLGPAAAVVVMTSVLIVQCLLFADGGLLALGANVFNMAIVGTLGGYTVYQAVRRLVRGGHGTLMAAAFASWCSTLLAATCCAGELAWSGTVGWAAGFPAMANVHMIIGIGEGLITALVLAAIAGTRPDLLQTDGHPETARTRLSWAIWGLVLSAGLVLFVSPFASSWPDGLQSVAAALGFEQRALAEPLLSPPLGGYGFPGIGSPAAATALAGLVGTVVVFFLSYFLSRALVTPSRTDP